MAGEEMPHILMLRPLHPDAIALFDARPDITYEVLDPVDPRKLEERIAAADAISVRVTAIPASLIARGNRLKTVARHGVGYDAVDVAALTARKIPLTITSGANNVSVAEHALALMLAVAKRLVEMDSTLRGGGWGQLQGRPMVELNGRTVLVLGHGRIGHRVANLCAAFGMKVLVSDPYIDQAKISAAGHTPVADLDEALPRADVITIHVPKSPATTDLIDAKRLARLPSHAILINTARGGIVNEPALIAALRGGKLLGAGLDVFEVEPTPKDNELLELPNVVVGAHLAAATQEGIRRMGMQCARNILDVLDGKPNPEMVVNKEVL
jgi:D-3-phosphoglycerate dehydrogenase